MCDTCSLSELAGGRRNVSPLLSPQSGDGCTGLVKTALLQQQNPSEKQ